MATPRPPLHLHQEVMLLALRNDKGTVAGGVMFAQAAGGAILAELMLSGRVRAVKEGRSTYAVVEDPSGLGEPVLDDCLAAMAAASRRRPLRRWVQKFSSTRRLKHRVAAGLVDRGILREAEDRVLLLFRRRLYPQLDGRHEQQLIRRLEDAIFSDAATVDPRTTVLVAIAHHAGLLRANFDRRRLTPRRARIAAIIKGDAIGEATKAAIDAAHAAVMVAGIMPAVIVSTTAR